MIYFVVFGIMLFFFKECNSFFVFMWFIFKFDGIFFCFKNLCKILVVSGIFVFFLGIIYILILFFNEWVFCIVGKNCFFIYLS